MPNLKPTATKTNKITNYFAAVIYLMTIIVRENIELATSVSSQITCQKFVMPNINNLLRLLWRKRDEAKTNMLYGGVRSKHTYHSTCTCLPRHRTSQVMTAAPASTRVRESKFPKRRVRARTANLPKPLMHKVRSPTLRE